MTETLNLDEYPLLSTFLLTMPVHTEPWQLFVIDTYVSSEFTHFESLLIFILLACKDFEYFIGALLQATPSAVRLVTCKL